jgi:hypothetical protein
VHVSGKLPETTSQRPALPRNRKFRFSKITIFCVICGNFGCNEAQIEKESWHAQLEARPENCSQRCARFI